MQIVDNLSDSDLISWIRLARTEGIGNIAIRNIIEVYKTASNAIEHIPNRAAKNGKIIKIPSKEEAYLELDRTRKFGANIIPVCDKRYSNLLRNIYNYPTLLIVKGNVNLLNKNCFAIVGSRSASLNAIKFAAKVASDMGAADFTIVSGFARGIDTAAHKGSLSTGTIAVLAGGIDNIYPKENENLYSDIIATGGAIVAELPIGTAPFANHFPQRNRIISGLSYGILVVEAALNRSGSLITAHMAQEQGRAVFAVPGFPYDHRSSGTNKLIKDNIATMVTNGASEIIEDISPMVKAPKKMKELGEKDSGNFNIGAQILNIPTEDELDKARPIIRELLSATPVYIDELFMETQIPINIIRIIILELEIAEIVQVTVDGRVYLCRFM